MTQCPPNDLMQFPLPNRFSHLTAHATCNLFLRQQCILRLPAKAYIETGQIQPGMEVGSLWLFSYS